MITDCRETDLPKSGENREVPYTSAIVETPKCAICFEHSEHLSRCYHPNCNLFICDDCSGKCGGECGRRWCLIWVDTHFWEMCQSCACNIPRCGKCWENMGEKNEPLCIDCYCNWTPPEKIVRAGKIKRKLIAALENENISQ